MIGQIPLMLINTALVNAEYVAVIVDTKEEVTAVAVEKGSNGIESVT